MNKNQKKKSQNLLKKETQGCLIETNKTKKKTKIINSSVKQVIFLFSGLRELRVGNSNSKTLFKCFVYINKLMCSNF